MSSDSHKEFIQRGSYASNPLGTATFVGLRSLDPYLQYQILTHGTAIVSKLGLASLPSLGASSLASLPLPSRLLLAMAAGSTVKQIFWLLYLCREEFIPRVALSVSIYNSLLNSLMSLFLVTAASSAALSTPLVRIPGTTQTVALPIALGTAMYAVGIVAETVAEVQRKRFKDDPANKGKICTTGLWSWARHANYGAYTIWRVGYALAAGSWPAAALVAAWHGWTFSMKSIPELDDYMIGRYDEQWKKYKKDVPYVLFPGIL
jgi:protein-S-isoprenylcysteine O-methyltransferase Ste14